MELQWIIQVLIGIIVAGLGYFMKALNEKVNRSNDRMHDLEIKMVSEYVTKEEVKEDLNMVRAIIDKVFEKLDESTPDRRPRK